MTSLHFRKTRSKSNPRRVLAYGAAVLLVSLEIVYVTVGAPSLWVLFIVVTMAACALTYAAWLGRGSAALKRLVHPWADFPEIAHLEPKDRRAFWHYCREQGLAPMPRAELVVAMLPSLVFGATGLVGELLFYSAPGRYTGFLFLMASALPAVLLLQIVALVRVHRRWVRKSISRDVLAQFLGRELPRALGAVRCPRCDYNLVAKTGDSMICPECGTSVIEPQE